MTTEHHEVGLARAIMMGEDLNKHQAINNHYTHPTFTKNTQQAHGLTVIRQTGIEWSPRLVGFFVLACLYRHSESAITEICAELLLARWAPHFDYNRPAGNFWVVAGSNDPWRCGLASPSMGSWINSAGVLPNFAEDDPSLKALEGGRTVRQWIT